jgi:lysophospholipase L1-like esterase
MIRTFINSISYSGYIPAGAETTVFEQSFNGADTLFINNLAGSTITDGKLNAQATGLNWSNEAYFNRYSTFERQGIELAITVNAKNTQLALGKNPKANTYGTAAGVDFNTNTLKIYDSYTNSTPDGILKSKVSAFNFEAGRSYTISYQKLDDVFTLLVKDVATGITESLSTNWQEHSVLDIGSFRGYAFVSLFNGDISIDSFKYKALYKPAVKFVLAGDSITDGLSIYQVSHDSYKDRWAYKVFQSNGAANIGHAGNTAAQLLARLNTDLLKFRPKYVHVLIGTNDTNFDTWKSNVQSIIDQIHSIGANPILGTVPPAYAERQTTYNNMNNWVKNSGYRVVNYAAALTVNNDEVTKDSTLLLSDGVHPNVAGHQKMYDQFVFDLDAIL